MILMSLEEIEMLSKGLNDSVADIGYALIQKLNELINTARAAHVLQNQLNDAKEDLRALRSFK
jgi:hypothetical protein